MTVIRKSTPNDGFGFISLSIQNQGLISYEKK